jgi:hypothetical protein
MRLFDESHGVKSAYNSACTDAGALVQLFSAAGLLVIELRIHANNYELLVKVTGNPALADLASTPAYKIQTKKLWKKKMRPVNLSLRTNTQHQRKATPPFPVEPEFNKIS